MGFLSDISDEIFGTESEVQQTQQPRFTPEQMALLQRLIGGAQVSPDVSDVEKGTQPFGGRLAPDLSSLERTSLAALEQAAMQAVSPPKGDTTMTAARGAVERGTSADQFNQEEFDRFFGESVAAPMLEMFKTEVLPELTRRFSGSAAFGSDRRVAEQQATAGLGRSLTSTRADLLFRTKEAGKERALRAAGMAPEFLRAETDQARAGLEERKFGIDKLLSLLAAGGVPRQVEAGKLSADYQEFLRQRESKSRAYDRALALLGISPLENTAIVKPGKPGLLQGLAPGLGAAAGYAMFL